MALRLDPVPGGRRQSYRVALRMARRDISRHKGRSLLIILLIMLPVGGMTGAATLIQSTQETAAEQVRYELGSTQARFRPIPAPNSQMVQEPLNDTSFGGGWQADPGYVPVDPRDVIPPGYGVLTEAPVAVTGESGEAEVRLIGKAVDALNPAFAGKYTLLQGRAPAAPQEVLVSPGLLKRLGLQLGEGMTTSAGTFTAVGTLRDATLSDNNAILFLKPGQAEAGTGERETLYYLVGDAPVTWQQILELNKQGVSVLSRSVLLDPPPVRDAAAPRGWEDWALYLTLGLVGALALLEVGLLAGAAFAVGAKRQVRELALLAASGAEAPTVRAVVTAGGLWLGAAGVLSGAALGLAGGAGVVLWTRLQGSVRFPGFHPDIQVTVVAMSMGLGACALAALVPARQVARQAALGALKSGRAPSVPGKGPARVGTALLVLAVLLLAAGGWLGLVGDDLDVLTERVPVVAGLLIGGTVLLVVALVLLTGGFVSLLTGHTGRLSLPLRLAARDSARNRTRTVPAVAAVLAAATLASAVMVLAASQFEDAKRTHYWSAHQFQATLPLTLDGVPVAAGPSVQGGNSPGAANPDPAFHDPDAVAEVVRQSLEAVEWTQPLYSVVTRWCDLQATEDGGWVAGGDPAGCLQYGLAVPAGHECPATPKGRIADASDWRCRGSMFPAGISGQLPQLIVGGADELRAVLGREPGQEALDVLENGGMAVSNPVYVQDGHTTLESTDMRKPKPTTGQRFEGYEVVTSTRLRAAVEVPVAPVPYYGVISPESAARLGLTVEPAALLVQLRGIPTDAEGDKVSAALARFYGVPGMTLYVERGADTDNSALLWLLVGLSALITLSAAGITTGLALADARTDHMTLAAVGAAPRLRKSLAGAQALMTAGLGTLLGLAAGVVPASLIVSATRMFAGPTIPWLQLLALLVAVPLTGSALAWIFTRARLPMSRRGVEA
ncbi:hypothetical protein [Pseudarthrobacter sp. DSP2-3-2b1]|uniref:hypothetical protein n=1 Tax=Pseudarthrobacter sp. DSP2-3-2b1 TaxID=2804661 RepID=UPI003CEF154E